jgi:hypothetical protein
MYPHDETDRIDIYAASTSEPALNDRHLHSRRGQSIGQGWRRLSGSDDDCVERLTD